MLNYNPNDILAGAPDAIALAAGCGIRNSHPLAEEIARDGALSTAAYQIGLKQRGASALETPRQVMSLGLRTADFGTLLAEGLAPVAARRFENAASHRAFAPVFEVQNYKPAALPGAVDVDMELPQSGELSELKHFDVFTTGGGVAQVRRYAANLLVSRETIINDEAGAVAAVVESAASAAARTEARLLYAALEQNPVMADGELVFHSDHGNVIAEALDQTFLAQAMGALRNQRTPAGNVADLPAAQLVVASDLELSAKKLIHDAGLEIAVTATALLPAGRWYLLADPSLQQTVAVLALRGSKTSFSIDPARTPIQYDGVALRGTASVGAAILSRIGIVRGGA